MKKITKSLLSLTLALLLLVTQVVHGVNAADVKKTSFLFTNDVHGQVSGETADDGKIKEIGYAELVGLKKHLTSDTHDVYLVDAGDALQGQPIAGLTKGEAIVDIMNQAGYDFVIPGNHEFDYGMERFLELANKYENLNYYSSNFVDLRINKNVFDSYKVFETNVGTVALVGITTPEAFTKSTPAYFQDENGNYIYGLCEKNKGQDLYDAVQKAVDNARKEADFVIAVGHVGVEDSSDPWRSKDIIANTTGIDAFIDGHSHSKINGEKIKNIDGKEILLAQTGTKFENIGCFELTKDGNNPIEASVELINVEGLNNDGVTADKTMQTYMDDILADFDVILSEKVGASEVDLNTHDAEGNRIIRNTPTNLGDLCADAYRNIMGADIGFMNGGGIRTNIAKGEITYGDIVSVFPFSNSGTLVEATGQQILDALEMSLADWPGENGGYLHTSGITYEFHSYLDSHVVKDDNRVFVKVDGEYRIKNVKVNGEPLDLEKTYKLASHDYMLKNSGDGYSMFKDCKVLKDATIVDNELLLKYIDEVLGGTITAEQYGKVRESRILVEKAPVEEPEKPVVPEEPEVPVEPEKPVAPNEKPDTSDPYTYYTYGSMAIVSLAAIGLLNKKENIYKIK